MKKILLTTLLTLVCAIGFADTWTDSEGNVWRFEISDNENHYVTLTGLESGENATVPGVVKIGEVDYYVREIAGWAFYENSNIIALSDLSECLTIHSGAFSDCSNLTSVGDLSACNSIEGNAFQYCSSLTSVGDLSACTSIGGMAFDGCSSLTSVDLSSCTSIGDQTFQDCSSLTSVDLSACTSIGNYAFQYCSSLTSVGDLSACTSIGGMAFYRCSSLTSVDLSACTSIGNDAFQYCSSLTSVNLSACTSIGNDAFQYCSSLTSVDLSVCTSIGNDAFQYCSSLTSVGDMSACTSIGGSAFDGCYSLRTITINTNDVPTIDGNFTPATTTILVKADLLSTYKSTNVWRTFANRIVSMDAQREYDITVVPPTTGSGIYDIIGEENLGNVISLKLSGEINGYDFLILRNNMPNLHSLDMSDVRIVAASDNKPYYDRYYTEDDVFPPYAFKGNVSITSVILPTSITEIGDCAFSEARIKEIEIPQNVKTIGGLAFDRTLLKTVTLNEGLKSLGDYAFRNCYYLETISFPSSLEEIGHQCFIGDSGLKSIVLPPSLTRIDGAAFLWTGITSVYATALDPKTVQMAADAFENYQNITLYIPYDEESGWDATYYAYYWNQDWGQFGYREKWTPKYSDITINADYEQDNGTIPSEDEVNINGQIGTNGGYIVGENASQELGNVTVEQDDEKGGSIIGEGNDNLSIENLQCNIKITPNKWYFFCFPFDVDWTEIDYAGVSYIWHKYDGSERAQGHGGWKKLQGNVNDKILHAGEGYIFQANHPFTLTIQYADPDMAAVNKAKELTTYVSSNPENASWNLIGNPFLSYYNMDGMGNTGNTEQYSAPVTVYDGNNYQALRPGDDDYQFHPFQAFFVQKPAGETHLTFDSEGRETYTQSVEVQNNARARRAKARKNPDRQIVNLTISDGENEDKTRVVFNEAKSIAYEAECDASKFFTTEAVPQIYSICNGVNYSINERPSAEGSVELGVKLCKEGTYTIEAVRMDAPMLLIDNETGITTDLNEGSYSFTAKAGTYAKRFTIVKANDATAIKNVENGSDNGAVYDLNGRKVSSSQRGIVIKANKKVLMK